MSNRAADDLLIFEKGAPGRRTRYLPKPDAGTPVESLIPSQYLRTAPAELPEVGELELVRHYTRLSQKTFSIDTHFYPLGSCTMKYNPKINEKVAALPGFARLHPLQPPEQAQGMLEVMHELQGYLAAITGMDAVSLQPAAGAHGELTGILMVKAYLLDQKQNQRVEALIPDSAHGTNPATCTLAGFKVVGVKSDRRGTIDIEDLKKKLSERTAVMMITNPNTLGFFESGIREISELLHRAGAQLYMDGANLNAIQGVARPAVCGADVMHLNLHKTFSTPHGGGGPGSGPVACRKHLEPFLPVPLVARDGERFRLDSNRPKSIGRVKSFFGNVGVLLRCYAYLRQLGPEGVRANAENAVLNANYLRAKLRPHFKIAHDRACLHEFVIDGSPFKKLGVHTLDVAKRLLDYGFHPPTIYFPLIVPECLMIEPTESESRETLDAFADALVRILEEAKQDPKILTEAPHTMPVRRLNEVKASREPVVRWARRAAQPAPVAVARD